MRGSRMISWFVESRRLSGRRALCGALQSAFALSTCAAASDRWAKGQEHEPAPTEIQEVTVTATRRAEPLSKVAISVSSIGSEEMTSRGVKQFDDLIRLTPGL